MIKNNSKSKNNPKTWHRGSGSQISWKEAVFVLTHRPFNTCSCLIIQSSNATRQLMIIYEKDVYRDKKYIQVTMEN